MTRLTLKRHKIQQTDQDKQDPLRKMRDQLQ